MRESDARVAQLGRLLLTSKLAQIGELLVVFGVGLVVILVAAPWVGEQPLARGALVWLANMLTLAMVWLGLWLRGQGWEHLGLSVRLASPRALLRGVLLSLVVFIAALAAFIVGAIVMAMIVGRPEAADLSGYDYLRGNLPLLILVLAAVYLGSSFGEEVTYRGFLITRIAELGSGGKGAWRLGVLASSIVFGLIHFAWGPAGMVQTGFMGLALGVSYLAVGRRLWVLVLAHAYMDTILLLQVYFAPG